MFSSKGEVGIDNYSQFCNACDPVQIFILMWGSSAYWQLCQEKSSMGQNDVFLITGWACGGGLYGLPYSKKPGVC